MGPKGWRKHPEGQSGSTKTPPPASSTPAPAADDDDNEKDAVKLDDLLLPKATIHKLATDALPQGSQLPSEGLLALRRSTSVFISYLSSEANHVAQSSGRKTVQPGDVFKALEAMGLAAFIPTMKNQLEQYETSVAEKKAAAKERKEKKGEEDVSDEEEEEGAKRAKLDAEHDQTEQSEQTEQMDQDEAPEQDSEQLEGETGPDEGNE